MKTSKNNGYSLRQVVNLTGLTEFTLRGWESRYGAFTPRRTPTGRRIYSSEDVMRAKALADLGVLGHRIGTVAALPLSRLHELTAAEKPVLPTSSFNDADRVMTFALKFEWYDVRSLMDRIRKKKTPRDFIFECILPLTARFGQEVSLGRFSIAQEHILSALIKQNLNALSEVRPRRSRSGFQIVFATPERDFHEIGILIAQKLAMLKGIDTLFLGANVPKKELCQTCIRSKATHVVISATTGKADGAKDDFYHYVNFIDRQLPGNIAIWLAGPLSKVAQVSLERPGRVFSDFASFEKSLGEIGR